MEKFPKNKKVEKPELTPEDLEKLYEIKIAPGSSLVDIEAAYKGNDQISFIITKGFDIILSTGTHASIYAGTGTWDYVYRGFLSENGGVEFYERSVENRVAILSKLKKFLNSLGLETPWFK